ncbi:unnamed protein product [Cuscuta campestris]|uniref:Uncharacterized protein n=1 Tax=Cuscuta campestris TaxID=132261 RepID=A0A484KM32_9ASTE|nr:unnamed protein product [Cuscuta campestris]
MASSAGIASSITPLLPPISSSRPDRTGCGCPRQATTTTAAVGSQLGGSGGPQTTVRVLNRTEFQSASDLEKDRDNLGFSSPQIVKFRGSVSDTVKNKARKSECYNVDGSLKGDDTDDPPSKITMIPNELGKTCENSRKISGSKRTEDIEQFKYVKCVDDDEHRRKKRNFILGRPDSPLSMKCVEKRVRGEEEERSAGMKNASFNDLMGALQVVLGKESDGVGLLETAKMRGWDFPRPRWWPPEGFQD